MIKNFFNKEGITKPNVYSVPETMIPKVCNSMGIALMRNQSLILSMYYGEATLNGADLIGTVLIGRVLIDLEHAESLNKALTKMLEDIKNDTTEF